MSSNPQAKLLAHSDELEKFIRKPTIASPLRVLISGCIAGTPCGIDGTDYGMGGCLDTWLAFPTIKVVSFCPEDHGLGTPRTMPDIHGGDGFDVLEGYARILDETNHDLTQAMLVGAQAMLEFAKENQIELALLTDMSAACGSQVISDGCRLTKTRKYRRGVGVATALLLRHGIPVLSQRDYKTLGKLKQLLDPSGDLPLDAKDHHETEWYRTYFDSNMSS